MFDNVALNVFIGLIAIFLLYSLLASILMEMLAKHLSLRARITLKAIYKLLDDSDYTEDWLLCRWFKSINGTRFFAPLKNRPLTALFYSHPNIKNLGKNNFNRKPSSITPEMFSDTLIQILRGDNFIGQQNQIDIIKSNLNIGDKKKEGTIELPIWYTNTNNKYQPIESTNIKVATELAIHHSTIYQLKQFLFDSHSDIDWFKQRLINWYNEMMDRSEGWYIKQTRFILFIIGFILAIGFNLDAISISKKLANDKQARDKMIEFAASISKDESFKGAIDTSISNEALRQSFSKANSSIKEAQSIIGSRPSISWNNFGIVILGWLITAFAISLGAPFWFDLLGKIMCIRQGGNNSSTDKQKKLDSTISNPTEQPIG